MTGRKVDLRRLGVMAAAFTVLVAVASAVTGIGKPWSVVAGGAVMLANYHLIRMLVSQLIRPESSKFGALFAFVGKFAVFFALVAGAFYRLPIEPMSFAVGATQLLAATVVEALCTGDPLEPLSEDDEARIEE